MNPRTGKVGLAGPHGALQTGVLRARGSGGHPCLTVLPAASLRQAAAGGAALYPTQEGGGFACKTCKSSCGALRLQAGRGRGASHRFLFSLRAPWQAFSTV